MSEHSPDEPTLEAYLLRLKGCLEWTKLVLDRHRELVEDEPYRTILNDEFPVVLENLIEELENLDE